MSDTHGEDVLALVRELSELEFRRGVLHAQIDWHMRLRQVAAQAAAQAAAETGPAVVELELVPPAKAPRQRRHVGPAPAQLQTRVFRAGGLRAAIVAYLAEHPDRTPRQVAHALSGHYESTRQALIRMAQAGVLKRTIGGSYAVAERPDGSSLVAAQG